MYYRNDGGTGFGASTAVLSLDYAIPAGSPIFGRADPIHKSGRFDSFDFAPDLGAEIGTRTWWRGLATCTTLCVATWMLSPGFRPLPATVPAAMPAAAFEETRAQSIAPLAWGGDSGRAMVACKFAGPNAGRLGRGGFGRSWVAIVLDPAACIGRFVRATSGLVSGFWTMRGDGR